ncbi:hypothetical protein QCA50_012876 [Cerrena zonata]|uniref:Uncharacterized protein n=1 Tax=Cerrena zonata TaxID=2478898 RepID=A0AAW0G4B4_9APHY
MEVVELVETMLDLEEVNGLIALVIYYLYKVEVMDKVVEVFFDELVGEYSIDAEDLDFDVELVELLVVNIEVGVVEVDEDEVLVLVVEVVGLLVVGVVELLVVEELLVVVDVLEDLEQKIFFLKVIQQPNLSRGNLEHREDLLNLELELPFWN